MLTEGGNYWVYNRYGMEPSWPKPISRISDQLPTKIDAAFKWTNGQSYLFAGHNYYRLTGWRIMKVAIIAVDESIERSSINKHIYQIPKSFICFLGGVRLSQTYRGVVVRLQRFKV